MSGLRSVTEDMPLFHAPALPVRVEHLRVVANCTGATFSKHIFLVLENSITRCFRVNDENQRMLGKKMLSKTAGEGNFASGLERTNPTRA